MKFSQKMLLTVFHTMVLKRQKWPKTRIKGGGGCLKQASNFGGTFDQLFLWIFYEIFTEDAPLLRLYHGVKKSKMTKNLNQGGGGGGSCLNTVAGNTTVSSISVTIRSMRNTNNFHFFFHFSKLFLPFPLPWWSNDLLVARNLQVAGDLFQHPPV